LKTDRSFNSTDKTVSKGKDSAFDLLIYNIKHIKLTDNITVHKNTIRCLKLQQIIVSLTNTHIHFMALWTLSGATRLSQYQKSKTNLDFTEARDSEWQ